MENEGGEGAKKSSRRESRRSEGSRTVGRLLLFPRLSDLLLSTTVRPSLLQPHSTTLHPTLPLSSKPDGEKAKERERGRLCVWAYINL